MYLDSGGHNRFDRIKDGDACMCIGSGIDDNAVIGVIGRLDVIHQITLVIGLTEGNLNAALGSVGFNFGSQLCIGFAAVMSRLADAQHVQIGTIDDHESHM